MRPAVAAYSALNGVLTPTHIARARAPSRTATTAARGHKPSATPLESGQSYRL